MKTASSLAFSMFAWTLNIASSVGIIFVNKFLMGQNHWNFGFSTTLTGAHFLCSACVTLILAQTGAIASSGKSLSKRDLFWYVLYGSMSVICLNISLLLNEVGFYQLMKLTVVPYVAIVEVLWRGKRYTMQQTAAMLCVVTGVAVVTISGVQLRSLLGMLAAILATIGSGMQQIYCAMLQKQYGMTSMDLLQATMWYLGSFTISIGPYLDYNIRHEWVTEFHYTRAVVCMIILSCGFAVLVNLSQFMVLGRFSAITYTTMGHSKTLLVLLGAWLVLGEKMTIKVGMGMLTAILGMVLYAYFTQQANRPAAEKAAAERDEEKALLRPADGSGKLRESPTGADRV